MNVILMGQYQFFTYELVENREKIVVPGSNIGKYVYCGKPYISESVNIKWEKILSYEGTPYYNFDNNILGFKNSINISENETVDILKGIFRADLGDYFLYTTEILGTDYGNKDAIELKYQRELARFNREIIESNEQLKRYCDINKLNYEETDCIELFMLLNPDSFYVIENGELKKSSYIFECTSTRSNISNVIHK